MYKINQVKDKKIKNPILIEGLPGLGNVGKIAVDFMIDNLKAEKLFEVHSHNFPHAVFVNEENLVELPTIEIYHKKVKNNDILFLSGDVQPIDETSCYEFCDEILDVLEKFNGKEIVAIGGIGLQEVPKNPKIYCTANNKKIINKYKTKDMDKNVYGFVGPIVGVTGLLVGLSKNRNIPAIALLAETYHHPTYLGIKGAREVLKVLNNKLHLRLNFKQLDKEIVEIEKQTKTKTEKLSKLHEKVGEQGLGIDYIG